MSVNLEVSREEAAIISAALLAYLGKPLPTTIPPTILGISREDVEKIVEDFYVKFKGEILSELESKLKKIEDRLTNIERRVSILRVKLKEATTREAKTRREEAAPIKFSWNFSSRCKIELDKNFLRYLPKSSSFWSFISKVEKYVSPFRR